MLSPCGRSSALWTVALSRVCECIFIRRRCGFGRVPPRGPALTSSWVGRSHGLRVKSPMRCWYYWRSVDDSGNARNERAKEVDGTAHVDLVVTGPPSSCRPWLSPPWSSPPSSLLLLRLGASFCRLPCRPGSNAPSPFVWLLLAWQGVLPARGRLTTSRIITKTTVELLGRLVCCELLLP